MFELDPSYHIKLSYQINPSPTYYRDDSALVHQPHLYEFAAYLARLYEAHTLIDIGCGRASKLMPYYPEFEVMGIDTGENLAYCRQHYPGGQWLDLDLDTPDVLKFDPALLQKSIVICGHVLEHLQHPEHLLGSLRHILEHAPVVLLTTPDRDLSRGYDHNGPPPDPSRVREWNKWELRHLLKSAGLRPEFLGYIARDNLSFAKTTLLAILANHQRPKLTQAPDDFRVLAVMHTFNEADVVEATLKRLFENGIDVWVVDNWSIDGTYDIVSQYLGKGVVGLEYFPAEGSTGLRQWREQLARTEEIVASVNYDWYIHHDADEMHESPWLGYRLKDALYHVDQCGFNAVNHSILNFYPVDYEPLLPQLNHTSQLNYFAFGEHPAYLSLIRAWKNLGRPVNLQRQRGHEVLFEGRRVFPYKFLMRHYPIRSQDHGERKVIKERLPRLNMETNRLNRGGNHYDHIRAGYDFVYNRLELEFFDPMRFADEYLIERLSMIGVILRDMSIGMGKDHYTHQQAARAYEAEIQRLKARIADLEDMQRYIFGRSGDSSAASGQIAPHPQPVPASEEGRQ